MFSSKFLMFLSLLWFLMFYSSPSSAASPVLFIPSFAYTSLVPFIPILSFFLLLFLFFLIPFLIPCLSKFSDSQNSTSLLQNSKRRHLLGNGWLLANSRILSTPVGILNIFSTLSTLLDCPDHFRKDNCPFLAFEKTGHTTSQSIALATVAFHLVQSVWRLMAQ